MADLWLRSQDKENLIKVINCKVNENKVIAYDENSYIAINIGEYKTKERALEVLDEIQTRLMPNYKGLLENYEKNIFGDTSKLTNIVAIQQPDSSLEIHELSTIVYEMPEE